MASVQKNDSNSSDTDWFWGIILNFIHEFGLHDSELSKGVFDEPVVSASWCELFILKKELMMEDFKWLIFYSFPSTCWKAVKGQEQYMSQQEKRAKKMLRS